MGRLQHEDSGVQYKRLHVSLLMRHISATKDQEIRVEMLDPNVENKSLVFKSNMVLLNQNKYKVNFYFFLSSHLTNWDKFRSSITQIQMRKTKPCQLDQTFIH